MEYRSPLARARGLGSAHHGVEHWWRQRVGALVLLPTGLWIVTALAMMPDVTYEEARAWIAHPVNAVVLLVFLGTSLHHAALGMQVIFEDYVSRHGLKVAGILFVNALCGIAALTAVYAVFRVVAGA
jgi:succinate dehydrogenase / fumarate reductase membrane anchor subunit